MRFLNVGMGLIEVLVALLVLSIGMLGVALIFVTDLRSSRTALLRTQAVNLVSDMADRIRANLGARAAYAMASYGGAPTEQGCASTAAPGSGNNCSVAQLAQDDLARWQSAVRIALPATPAGVREADVEYFAGIPDRYLVTVTWQEPSEPQPFSHQAEIFAQSSP